MSKDEQKKEDEVKKHEEEKLEGMPLNDFFDFVDDFQKRARKGEEPYKTLGDQISNYPRQEPAFF